MSKKVLGNLKKGRIFVISAPAGTGKSTLVDMLLNEFPDAIAESCSSTTRLPRSNEIASAHYEFISVDEFQMKIDRDEFLEYAEVFGAFYGTRRQEVERLQNSGKHVILVIDTQGALQLKSVMPSAIFIFITPPSMEELQRRLFKRQTESQEKIAERLAWAAREFEMIPHYDYHIVNDHLEISYQILRSILVAEEHKKII